jgi:transposase-like protein
VSKYSNEFKLEVVKYYLAGYGYGSTAKHFNMKNGDGTVKKWSKKARELRKKFTDNELEDFKIELKKLSNLY